ncbi:MAG: uroporphyrinogen-III synthase [Longimonas sp.]|uniref:uroporphyrinogen-III synthase n=1 Tax=Longimonas sp. TaxID=2039626 RepID=UPI003975AA8B
MTDRPIVLLRHPRISSGADPYVQALQSLSVSVQCTPVLAFDIDPPPTLDVLLARPARYDALLCTSPRAVRALEQVLPSTHPNHARWADKPAYVVGPRTAQAVAEWGGTPVGADAGGAAALADQIVADAPGPLLFVSGNRRRDTLPNALVSAGQMFDEVESYRTRTRSTLNLPPPPAWLVFFSPSGTEAVQASGYDLASYPCAAIGPTTATALREQGAAVRAVADAPTPEALATAVQEAIASP